MDRSIILQHILADIKIENLYNYDALEKFINGIDTDTIIRPINNHYADAESYANMIEQLDKLKDKVNKLASIPMEITLWIIVQNIDVKY